MGVEEGFEKEWKCTNTLAALNLHTWTWDALNTESMETQEGTVVSIFLRVPLSSLESSTGL